MEKIQWKPLLASVGFSLGLGALAGFLTSGSMEEYQQIYKVPLSPPGWLFPIVWTILYIFMGIAAYRVYISEDERRAGALKYYVSQLVVNIIWPFIFFNFDMKLLALAWLILLDYLVWETSRLFCKIDELACKLMIPYLVWLGFATYLNLAMVIHYVL